MARILMVLSGADHWTLADGTQRPAGYWAEEFVVPHERFRGAGHTVDVATPGGRQPTPDPVSFDPEIAGAGVAHYADYIDSAVGLLKNPLPLADVDTAVYDAVVVTGGHGPMEDLAFDQEMARVLLDADADSTILAAVCHGPAALLSVSGPDGSWPFAGRELTALTNEEERLFGTAAVAPWLLESRLRERGAHFKGGTPWEPHVVVDGRLITGQNPASSSALAGAVLDRLPRS